METGKISKTVTAKVVERGARKLIILHSRKATDYWSYCEEVGCDWEGLMNGLPEKLDTAAFIELPKHLIAEGTSAYASGIEVPIDFSEALPPNYEIVELPACKMLYLQGMPFTNEADFSKAIEVVGEAMKNYMPENHGLQFAFEMAPIFNFGASPKTGAKMAVPVKSIP